MSRKSKLQAVPLPAEEEQKEFEITGAQLKDIFCNYSYDHNVAVGTVNSVNIKSQVPVHKDLLQAFKALNPHLAVICEEVDADVIGDISKVEDFDPAVHAHESLQEKLSRFSVHAFSVSGEGDTHAVTLKGYKRLSTGELVKLETPAVNYEGQYHFLLDLRFAIDQLVDEVDAYRQGKQAPKFVQQEMFEEEQYSEAAI